MPFISTLSFHGVNISIVGNKSTVKHDPSFVKQVIVGDNGELIVDLEDIREGRLILSIPKPTNTDDIFEKFIRSEGRVSTSQVEISPFVDDSLGKRQRSLPSSTSTIAEVSPQEEDEASVDIGQEEPTPKKQMARSVKKKISLSSEADESSHVCIASPIPATISRSSIKSGKQPDARWGHTMTKVSNNRLVVYGGQSEEDQTTGEDQTVGNLFVYHPEEGAWVEPENCESIPRVWHTATYLPEMNLIVTFGGERAIDGNLEFLDDIMVLDTEIFLWYPPAVSGRSPSPRAGHSAALMVRSLEETCDRTPELVVFGGTRGRKWESSLHVLNCHRWEWSRPKISGTAPAARSYHSATPIHDGKEMVIFGGNDGDSCFNDVIVLSSTADQWAWRRPLTTGEKPKPRTGHSACLLQDGKTLLIHGGWNPSDSDEDEVEYFKDAYTLNTGTWEWCKAPHSFLEQVASARRQAGSTEGITGHVIEVVSQTRTTPLAIGEDMEQMVAIFGGQCSNSERTNDMIIASI